MTSSYLAGNQVAETPQAIVEFYTLEQAFDLFFADCTANAAQVFAVDIA